MIRLFFLGLLLVAASGCATKSHHEEVLTHPDYDVSSFGTYRWADDPVAVIGILTGAETAQMVNRIKQLVNAELQAKGYRLVERRNADMMVTTMVGAIEQTSYSEHVVNAQRYYDAQVRWSQENDYLRGAVSVIFTHPDSRDVIIWQGSVGEDLANNPALARGTMRGFIERIGELLPPSR